MTKNKKLIIIISLVALAAVVVYFVFFYTKPTVYPYTVNGITYNEDSSYSADSTNYGVNGTMSHINPNLGQLNTGSISTGTATK